MDSKWLSLLKEFWCIKSYYGGYDNLEIFFIKRKIGNFCERLQGNKDELLQNMFESLFIEF